ILPMTITEWLFPPDVPISTADPEGVTHLSISPMEPGENEITVELSDLAGQPLETPPEATVTLQHRPMTPDGTATEVELAPVTDQPAAWAEDALSLPDQGWYAIDVTLHHADDVVGTTTFYLLLPDPSVHGADAVDLPESDPEAETLYLRALDTYGSWETGRWRESLGSGTDVVVVSQFAVTSLPGEPPASEMSSQYAGSFRTRPDGTEPEPPRRNFSSRITIGDQSWIRQDEGAWESVPALETASWEERADIYTGATNVQPGGTETINGVETEIATFYLPQKGGQSEAWFAWWINPETGDPLRMAMVAKMHFMIWDVYDINAPITIAPPPGPEGATPSSTP
ncbi:MAG TPA: hypothetical protein VD789_05055, partial [Thermomicrobiales bacterium]|nr:hypothetical protein [Thermomicrobiales bacterium]